MEKKVKLKITVILAAACISCTGSSAIAKELGVNTYIETRYEDHIIVKYRYKNGILQYRRWNDTKNCWVDPDWINL